MFTRTRHAIAVAAAISGIVAVGAAPAQAASHSRPDFTLTILHNNDGESSVLPREVDTDGDGIADESYGGAARFFSKVARLRLSGSTMLSYDEGEAIGSYNRSVVLLNSGDNFLAGPNFQASRAQGAPFYDAEFVKALRYDALAIGNHEFDFGPGVFDEFAEAVQPRFGRVTPFVSANLDYTGFEPLAENVGEGAKRAGFVRSGKFLVPSVIIGKNGRKIGVVGATTTSLASISSPVPVDVLQNVAELVQAEVDALTDNGVDIIIVQAHLQGIESEAALAGHLRDVDAIIAGGGDEVLATPGVTQLAPGDENEIFAEYPFIAIDADGKEIPVVTTPGNYEYVGALELTFDRRGNVIGIGDDSGIKVVTDTGAEAVFEYRPIKREIEDPVAAFNAELANTIIGQTEVVLDCERVEVRGAESNCANLVADAHLAAGRATAAELGLDIPQVAFQNGGGVRGEVDQPSSFISGDALTTNPAPLSILDTFALQPFGNFVAIAENVPAEAVRQIIEEGAIRLPSPGDGGFTQVSEGTVVVIDPSFPARVADQDTGVEVTPGQRVRELVLADGTVVVSDGVTQDITVDLVQLNFSLFGGDAQPDLSSIPGVTVTIAPLSDQQSLQAYIESLGTITEADYPRDGEGRITIVK